MDLLKSLAPLVFPAIVVAAAVRDVTSFTIPNWMSLLLLATFFPVAWLAGLSGTDFAVALALGLAGLVVGFGFFVVGWIGGGDAKLLAAAAPWVGLTALPSFLIATVIAGGVLAAALLWLRSGWLAPHLANSPPWLGRLATAGEGVPYGVAIAIGALLAFPETQIANALITTF